jgi:hypothetical protein
MLCNGNRQEECGGPNRLTLFQLDSLTTSSSISSSSTSSSPISSSSTGLSLVPSSLIGSSLTSLS